MATTKLWPVHSNTPYVADYLRNPIKTTYDELIMPRSMTPVADVQVAPYGIDPQRLICGIHCNPLNAVSDFFDVKTQFNKHTGVLAYHGYISFPNADNLDPVDVLSLAKEVAEEMWGTNFQVLLAVHTNTETLHCHFLVNSVSYVDGHKAVNNDKNYYRLKHIADSMCQKYGLVVPKKGQRKMIDYAALEEELVDIRMASPTKKELRANLEKAGIKYCDRQYIRIKDGRFVKLASISPAVENLFKYLEPEKKDDTPTMSSVLADMKAGIVHKKKKKKKELEPETEPNVFTEQMPGRN